MGSLWPQPPRGLVSPPLASVTPEGRQAPAVCYRTLPEPAARMGTQPAAGFCFSQDTVRKQEKGWWPWEREQWDSWGLQNRPAAARLPGLDRAVSPAPLQVCSPPGGGPQPPRGTGGAGEDAPLVQATVPAEDAQPPRAAPASGYHQTLSWGFESAEDCGANSR